MVSVILLNLEPSCSLLILDSSGMASVLMRSPQTLPIPLASARSIRRTLHPSTYRPRFHSRCLPTSFCGQDVAGPYTCLMLPWTGVLLRLVPTFRSQVLREVLNRPSPSTSRNVDAWPTYVAHDPSTSTRTPPALKFPVSFRRISNTTSKSRVKSFHNGFASAETVFSPNVIPILRLSMNIVDAGSLLHSLFILPSLHPMPQPFLNLQGRSTTYLRPPNYPFLGVGDSFGSEECAAGLGLSRENAFQGHSRLRKVYEHEPSMCTLSVRRRRSRSSVADSNPHYSRSTLAQSR